MDVTLQRHCARYIYVVPEGLRELMSDISREVLRSQPEDIYTFIADYLDALLITRENARVSARFVQYLTEAAETIVELLQRTGMSREQADKSAEVIQETFKTWSSRKGILKEDEDLIVAKIIEDADISPAQVEAAAAVIQHAFKAFKARQQKEAQLLSGIIDWRVAARSAIRLYRRTGVSPEEAKRAANLIKAAYKGYYTRRAIRVLNEQQEEEDEFEYASDEDMSGGSGERKAKGVRIDYTSVVPHVDFGDEELITKDLQSILEEEVEPVQNEDVMARIFGEEAKDKKTDADYIRELLNDLLRSVVCEQEIIQLPVFEDKDSDIDTFIPAITEEQQQQNYSRPLIIPGMSQDDLESQLMEAQDEVQKLQEEKTSGDMRSAEETTKVDESGELPQESDAVETDEATAEENEEPTEKAPSEDKAVETDETTRKESSEEQPVEPGESEEKSVEADDAATKDKPVETDETAGQESSVEADETARKESSGEKAIEADETARKESSGEKSVGTDDAARKESGTDKPVETDETAGQESSGEKPVEADETLRKESSGEKPVETDEPTKEPTEEEPELPTNTQESGDANETKEEPIEQTGETLDEPTQQPAEVPDENPTEPINETNE